MCGVTHSLLCHVGFGHRLSLATRSRLYPTYALHASDRSQPALVPLRWRSCLVRSVAHAAVGNLLCCHTLSTPHAEGADTRAVRTAAFLQRVPTSPVQHRAHKPQQHAWPLQRDVGL